MDQSVRNAALAFLDALVARDNLASEDEQVRALETAFAPLEAIADEHGVAAVIFGAHVINSAFLNLTMRKYNVDALNVIAEVRHRCFGDEGA